MTPRGPAAAWFVPILFVLVAFVSVLGLLVLWLNGASGAPIVAVFAGALVSLGVAVGVRRLRPWAWWAALLICAAGVVVMLFPRPITLTGHQTDSDGVAGFNTGQVDTVQYDLGGHPEELSSWLFALAFGAGAALLLRPKSREAVFGEAERPLDPPR